MKKILILCGIAAAVILFLPFILVKGWGSNYAKWVSQYGNDISINVINQNGAQNIAQKKVKVLMSDIGEVKDIDAFDYVCGAVAGEMSANSETEALKAQAVAAFTYMVYRMEAEINKPGLIPEHKGAYVCTDSTHCQAYLPKDKALQKWGSEWFNKYWFNIENAVSSVLGKVIVYSNEPINAVFYAISGGLTESSKDVWNVDIPYLASVESAWDKNVQDYQTALTVSEADFKSKMTAFDAALTLDGEASKWTGNIERSQAGGIINIAIGGKTYKGTDIRKIFDLRSANFDINYKNSAFTFTVRGSGHGVGMSQAGAEYLAKQSKNYEEILKYYYHDVEITQYEWN